MAWWLITNNVGSWFGQAQEATMYNDIFLSATLRFKVVAIGCLPQTRVFLRRVQLLPHSDTHLRQLDEAGLGNIWCSKDLAVWCRARLMSNLWLNLTLGCKLYFFLRTTQLNLVMIKAFRKLQTSISRCINAFISRYRPRPAGHRSCTGHLWNSLGPSGLAPVLRKSG